MVGQPAFTIDLSEEFDPLEHAPIVEAVIHWRARGGSTPKQDELRKQLVEALPDYPTIQTQHELHVESELGPAATTVSRHDEWLGFRLESEDGRNIAQFTRNGFVFSRVAPYEDWAHFSAEAQRLWRIHVDLTKPSEIERLGVRFINRIIPVDLGKLDQTLAIPPQSPSPLNLPISEFLHRTLFDVPGHDYRVHVIQASQPPLTQEDDAVGVILDIDVFTTGLFVEITDSAINKRLNEMRWLKNKAFFSLLRPEAIKRFKGATS